MKGNMFMFKVDFNKDKEEKSFTNKTIMTCLLKVEYIILFWDINYNYMWVLVFCGVFGLYFSLLSLYWTQPFLVLNILSMECIEMFKKLD